VTLVAAAPLLVSGLVMTRTRRAAARGALLLLGVIAYAVYNYAFYLLGAALNAFFPLYVLALVLSVVTLIVVLTRLDVSDVAASFVPTTPVRFIGGYLGFVGVGLGSVWIAIWATYTFAGRPTPVDPEVFKLVAALDLTLMVTGLTLGGALLWRRNRWGYIVGGIAGVQASLYLLVLSVNSIVAIHRGIAAAPGELPMWAALALATTAVTAILLANVRRHRTVRRDELVGRTFSRSWRTGAW